MRLEQKTIKSTLSTLLATLLIGNTVAGGTVFAGTGSVYLSPSATSVQQGSTVSINIRINPGTTVDGVEGTLTFDTTKVQFLSVTAGPAFSAELQNSASGNTVRFARGDFGSGVSGDSLIETVSFKALVGSGSAAFGLSGANATASGAATNPASSGTSVSFSTPPAPSCPAGQTGTPPNCVTPPTTGGGSSGGSAGGGSTTAPKPTTGSSSSNGANGSKATTTVSPDTGQPAATTEAEKPKAVTAQVTDSKLGYAQASLKVTSQQPTKVYVRFGTDGKLTQQTEADDFATSHTIKLDPKLLLPGETYSYSIVSVDQNGLTSETATKTFTLKGMTVRVGVFDSSYQPLRNQTVTLHSKPYTVKTDGNGFATFTNVVPGDHHISYTSGGKTYEAAVQVQNNVTISNGTEKITIQNAAAVYPFAQPASNPLAWFLAGAGAVLGLLLIGVMFWQRRRLLAKLHHGAPTISDPKSASGVHAG